MVRVGEVTGTLGESLKTIASFMEKRQRVESKVLTAMIYPIVLVVFCLVAILILTTKVIPHHRQADPAGRAGAAVDHAAVDELQPHPDELVGAGAPRRDRRDRLAAQTVLPDRAGGLPAGQVPAVAAGVRAADQAARRGAVRLDALDADRLGPVDGRIAARRRRDDGQHAHETGDPAGAGADPGRAPTSPRRCATAA